MTLTGKKLLKTAMTISLLFIIFCTLVFMMQEGLIFFPSKLTPDYAFKFKMPYEEHKVTTQDGVQLHGLLFKADNPDGVILYLHGNAGSVDSWGMVAPTYTALNKDIFILDYRGYGKSEGNIHSEQQFYDDVQSVYDYLSNIYEEQNIIVLGYSIGTGPATKIAADNQPKQLILLAPYYSLVDLARKHFPFIPAFLLKYKFKTYKYIQKVEAPITIFHGRADEVIYYGSSERLKKLLKPKDQLIPLIKQAHNGIDFNPEYQKALSSLLVK